MLNLQRDIITINFYQHLKIFIATHIKKNIQTNTIIFNKTRKIIVPYIDIKIFIQARRQLL